jgi:hypothetical protein
MNDPTLFDQLPPVSRNTDPDTSHAAEAQLSARNTQLRRLYVRVCRGPVTTEEAGNAAGIVPWQVATKRMSDLKTMGLIRDSGARAVASTGRKVIVWEQVPRA